MVMMARSQTVAPNRDDPGWQGPEGYEFALQIEQDVPLLGAMALADRVLRRGRGAFVFAPGHWADYVHWGRGRNDEWRPRWVPTGWTVYRPKA